MSKNVTVAIIVSWCSMSSMLVSCTRSEQKIGECCFWRTPKMVELFNLSSGVARNARFTTNRMCAKNNTTYMWCEQAIMEWSRRVASIAACCHSVKFCGLAGFLIATEQPFRPCPSRAKPDIFFPFSNTGFLSFSNEFSNARVTAYSYWQCRM